MSYFRLMPRVWNSLFQKRNGIVALASTWIWEMKNRLKEPSNLSKIAEATYAVSTGTVVRIRIFQDLPRSK